MNLYDKYVKQDWRQLWADENRAFVILPDKVVEHYYTVISDNGIDVLEYNLKSFGQAIDLWNKAINQYLDQKITA